MATENCKTFLGLWRNIFAEGKILVQAPSWQWPQLENANIPSKNILYS